MPDTAYECLVSVYDNNGDASNRIKGPAQTFFVKEALSSTYNLTTSVQGQGSIEVSPDASPYDDGTEVTLTATPSGGHTFTGWSGNASGTDNPLTVTMNGSKNITAIFSSSGDDGDGDGDGDGDSGGSGGGGGGGCFISSIATANR
jgi:uncharacterized repeat protein (TIGR02543 family)